MNIECDGDKNHLEESDYITIYEALHHGTVELIHNIHDKFKAENICSSEFVALILQHSVQTCLYAMKQCAAYGKKPTETLSIIIKEIAMEINEHEKGRHSHATH